MGGCNDCYTGCTQITSDQCVKYTGDDISSLDITSGDSLATVEQKIVEYLLSVMDGTGIVPVVPAEYLCTVVSQYMPAGDATLVEVLTAIVRAACDLQTDIDAVETSVSTIEANYSIGACLTGVTASSGTHDILQAVINELCAVALDVAALQSALSAYVEIADLDAYIAAYLASTANSKMYTRMVPYTAVEFWGDVTGKFDATGAGYGDWEQIYLCNGQNGTPDKRGRITVGCTTMGCTVYADPATDPAISGNPVYDLLDTYGANNVTLTTAQIPAHTHSSTSTVNDPGHRHLFGGDDDIAGHGGYISYGSFMFDADSNLGTMNGRHYYTKKIDGTNNLQPTDITVSTSNTNTGGGLSHNNIPPVIACHYIIYIPD